mmetsp:Transcript_42945/g.69680  ORF Transcript_42945/g.69680 Transcript_42945/m.69680 type:complete len:98 (+) Transcript_42945:226-519(+)
MTTSEAVKPRPGKRQGIFYKPLAKIWLNYEYFYRMISADQEDGWLFRVGDSQVSTIEGQIRSSLPPRRQCNLDILVFASLLFLFFGISKKDGHTKSS